MSSRSTSAPMTPTVRGMRPRSPVLPRSAFPARRAAREAGALFRAWSRGGKPIIFSVIEVKDENVVDANHPLAGQALRVSVLVLSVRDATDDERTHGHVHDQVSPPSNLA